MKKFVCTSTLFEGGIVFIFNEDDQLVSFDIQAKLSKIRIEWFHKNLPLKIDDLVIYKQPSFKLLFVVEEITFSDFYVVYNYKVGRLKAEAAWNKLSKADQLAAYSFINEYERFLAGKPGLAKLYPASYLNQKRWRD